MMSSSSPTPTYSAAAIAALDERIEYEAWLLEAVYEITDDIVPAKTVDEFIYPPDGAPPGQRSYASANCRIGDWRPGFLEAGAPLVFVTAFKVLDMLLEWVLNQNGKGSTFRFVEKIAGLKKGIVFPPLVEARPWLRERLIALYEQLEPLRGTVIHAPHFTSAKGALQISSSKRGVVGPVVGVAPLDLRNMAFVLVSLLHYLRGTWTMDAFREKRVRRAMDELAPLHGKAPLGQLRPALLNVRVHFPDSDPFDIDLSRIRADLQARRADDDVMFDVQIVSVAHDGKSAEAFLVPWDKLQAPALRSSKADLSRYSVPLPPDIDVAVVARAMKLIP